MDKVYKHRNHYETKRQHASIPNFLTRHPVSEFLYICTETYICSSTLSIVTRNYTQSDESLFLPQIYLTLIISDLYLYGTKMSPQFE